MLNLFFQIVSSRSHPQVDDPLEDIRGLFPVRLPSGSPYAEFTTYIVNNKPDWYRTGKWLLKSMLVEKFNERYENNISLKLFMRCMHAENLMDYISDGEKRSRINGKLQRLFLCKDL